MVPKSHITKDTAKKKNESAMAEIQNNRIQTINNAEYIHQKN